MARRARIALAGVPMHLIQRGNNGSACFHAEADHRRYLDDLRVLSVEFECPIHACVLMTNHVHLLATPGRADSVSLMMKRLGQRYVQYINRHYQRSGWRRSGLSPTATLRWARGDSGPRLRRC